MKRNLSLTYLNLSTNSIFTAGGKALKEAIKRNRKLTKLVLDKNAITQQIIAEISNILKQNIKISKRRILPKYIQQLKSIIVDKRQIREIERKVEEYKQSKDNLSVEISEQDKKLEKARIIENARYEKVKEKYEEASIASKQVDTLINESNIQQDELCKEYEKSLQELNEKMRKLNRKIISIEESGIYF